MMALLLAVGGGGFPRGKLSKNAEDICALQTDAGVLARAGSRGSEV